MNILSQVKVLDVTKVFSGPFATRMLADYGAEVIKIENEKNYDDSRNFPPLKNGWSGYYEILNRNKYGVSINLKDPSELEHLYRLVKDADVFVENLTPSTKFKLKIDYEILKSLNPKIIYASLSGLGQDSDRKYYDVCAQAQSGMMTLSGESGRPVKIGPAVVDAFAGMTLAFAIASALYYREKSGKGQYLDVPMISCAMNLLESNMIDYSITSKNPVPSGNYDTAISPFGIYQTKDGHIVVAAGNDRLWNELLQFLKGYALVREDLFTSNDLRLQNNAKLTTVIESVFKKFTVHELEAALAKLNVPCSKVNSMSDVFNDQENYTRKSLMKFQHDKLGECVIPGASIHFSAAEDMKVTGAPEIGRDNKKYGI